MLFLLFIQCFSCRGFRIVRIEILFLISYRDELTARVIDKNGKQHVTKHFDVLFGGATISVGHHLIGLNHKIVV